MAIVIPDLFGAFQKGREYAIDRNWKDLTNYEAIEKARNENDLGALNLLERRVMFAPKMGMYMDNADMSARNNALGGAAFSGLMAKTQAQSAYDTAKAKEDMGLLPKAMETYRNVSNTSFGTANTESAVQNATNAETMKNAKTLGDLAAQQRLYATKYGELNARNAFNNAIKMNKVLQGQLELAIDELEYKNSEEGKKARAFLRAGDALAAQALVVQNGIDLENLQERAKIPPSERVKEPDAVKPTLSPEQINYAIERIQLGTNTVGQPLTAGELDYYTSILNTEAAANYINQVYKGNLTFYPNLMARAGELSGTALTNNSSGSKNIVGQNPNNAGASAGNNSAGNNSDFRYDPMTGERIVQLVPYSQAVNNSAGNFYIRGDNTFTPYPYNMTTRPLSGGSFAGWTNDDIAKQLALQKALVGAGYLATDYPNGISLFDLSIRDPQNKILIPANQKAYYQQFGW